MKVGDKVILKSSISLKKRKGEIYEIFEIDNMTTKFYRIDVNGEKLTIFNNELIELDIEEIRNDKLNQLGI